MKLNSGNIELMKQNHPLVIDDAEKKRVRVRRWMQENNYEALILSRRDNFSWITSGGDSSVCLNITEGAGFIVITEENHYLIAPSMDATRLIDEQMPEQGYIMISMQWYEGNPIEKVLNIVAGKKSAADIKLPGIDEVYSRIVDLHWPMSELEIERTKYLSHIMDKIFFDTALSIYPGMTEIDIARTIRKAQLDFGVEADTMIVGSDERNYKYRHPLPTDTKVQNYVMLHSAARKWGLHVNLTRCVTFGKPPEALRKIFNTVSSIQAHVIKTLAPGMKFSKILELEIQLYKEFDYPDEWRYHYLGGPLGYVIVDAERCLTDKVVQNNQAFEWFITITGTKVAELVLLTNNRVEIPSLISDWPLMEINTKNGNLLLPDMFER